MGRRMLNTLLAVSTAVSMIMPCSFSVSASDVSEETSEEMVSTFDDDFHRANVEFKATYSAEIEPTDDDFLCITFRRQVNVDEDPESAEEGHLEVDASKGIRGYIKPGWYDVIGIDYFGNNANLKGVPIACSSLIRVYADKPVKIPIAVGPQAIKELKKEIGEENVYVQLDGKSEYTKTSTLLRFEDENANPQSVFTDLSVFGSDEEAKQRYLAYLEEEGLVDEKYQYTDKAKTLFEDASAGEPVGVEVLDADGTEEVKPTISAGEDNLGDNIDEIGQDDSSSDYNSSEEDNVKVKYFDDEEKTSETQKEEAAHPILTLIIKYLPEAVFLIGLIVVLIWYKKH